MVYIENYHTFNYGACTGFGKIYTFCINVHDLSYIYCYTNKKLGKQGWLTNYATQTGNWNKTFNIKPTCFIFSCVIRKANAHVDKKALNMHYQSQKGSQIICIGIPQHQKGYLIYVPSTGKIVSSHDVVFCGTFLFRYHTHHVRIQRHSQRN